MAKVSFEAAVQNESINANRDNANNIGFFSLKNNGDFAIVRFMESNVSEFNLLTCHDIQLNGKYRKLNCIRSTSDPIDMCPACKAQLRTSTRFFARMLQYVTNEQGEIEVKPVVWERSLNYASQIRDLIMNYGDLKNCIFKITRNGAAGDMKTTYSIMYCPEQMCPQNKYPIVENAFDNYNPLGTIVLDKKANEIETFLATGNFPAPIPKETLTQPQQNMSTQVYNTPQPVTGVTPQVYNTPVEQVPVQNPQPVFSGSSTGETLPWENQSTTGQAVERPIRVY